MIPPPRLCETPGCTETIPTDHDPEGIDQVFGKLAAWVWDCAACGRKRIEPVRRPASFSVEETDFEQSST